MGLFERIRKNEGIAIISVISGVIAIAYFIDSIVIGFIVTIIWAIINAYIFPEALGLDGGDFV